MAFTHPAIETTTGQPVVGFMAGTQATRVINWNESASREIGANTTRVFSVDIVVPDDAEPGQTFSFQLPEYWRLRSGGSLANLVDAEGVVIATAQATGNVPGRGNTAVEFTLTDHVRDRSGISGHFEVQIQVFQGGETRPAGDYVAPITSGDGSAIIDLRLRLGEPYWSFANIEMSWSGKAESANGIIDVLSEGSWDGASDVTMRVPAGSGYDFDCASLRNQDPSVRFGIGLVDVGAGDDTPGVSATLLDPSQYSLECSSSGFVLHMPASSWTSADAETGQVLRAVVRHVDNADESWKVDGGVFADAVVSQNGTDRGLTKFNPAPGSSASADGTRIPNGAFVALVFEDMNRNDVFDAGIDTVLPGIDVEIEGVSSGGVPFSGVLTTDDEGRVTQSLRPGTYTATVTTPDGLNPVTAHVGDDDTVDSDFVDGSTGFDVVSLQTTYRDAGFAAPEEIASSAIVSGVLFEDMDGDDVRDEKDRLVPDVVVTVVDSDGGRYEATTDASGAWELSVATGLATVTYSYPEGFTEVAARQGDDRTVDSDVVDGVAEVEVVAPVGASVDAGIRRAAQDVPVVPADPAHTVDATPKAPTGTLATTGAGVGAAVTLAFLLIGGGGALLWRRRLAAKH